MKPELAQISHYEAADSRWRQSLILADVVGRRKLETATAQHTGATMAADRKRAQQRITAMLMRHGRV